jgi:hypothetical protein
MINQLFETVEISFEELAINVWPNLVSGQRVKTFTCFITPLPEVPFTMLNFVVPHGVPSTVDTPSNSAVNSVL